MLTLSTALGLALAAGSAKALENGLARTPQMGWNTWNTFACNVDEELILSAAKTIVDSGLKEHGYEYVVIDDCWQAAERDPETGRLDADAERFPRGMKAMADEIHAMGLKIGIYSDAGVYTCGRRLGSLDYEEVDAQTYASWEVDYLKYDNCYNQGRSGVPKISFDRYEKMSKALNATGRPILYSMCNWGEDGPWNWATEIANSWRMSGDIIDVFTGYDDRCPCIEGLDCKLPGYHCSMTNILNKAAPIGQKAAPGHWNDLDMLEVGNGDLTRNENIAHFTMWSMVKSPLIMGHDLTKQTEETIEILTNKAILNINQDPLGRPAVRLWKRPVEDDGDLQLWMGNLANQSTVIAVLNTSPEQQTLDVSFADVFKDSNSTIRDAPYQLYDLWERSDRNTTWGGSWGADAGVHQGAIQGVVVPSHAVKVWRAFKAE